MNVRSQPDVVGQIPAIMVGILVDHDVVGIPDPVIAIADIVGSNRKIEAAKPETARASPFDAKHVSLAEPAGKSSVLPGTIEVVVRIILACVMPDPLVAAGVDVGRFGMPLLIAVGTSLFWSLSSLLLGLAGLLLRRSGLRRRCGTGVWRWAVCGNMPAANATHGSTFLSATTLLTAVILGRRRNCNQQEREQHTKKVFHFHLLNVYLKVVWNCAWNRDT